MKILSFALFYSIFLFAQNHGTSGTPGFNGGGTADFQCNQLRESIDASIAKGVYPAYASIHQDFDQQTYIRPFLKTYYMELLLASTSKKKTSKDDVEKIICDQDHFKFQNLDFLEMNGDSLPEFDYEAHKKVIIELKDLGGLYGRMAEACETPDNFYFKVNQMIFAVTNHFETLISEDGAILQNKMPN